jgi:hypothetical protein
MTPRPSRILPLLLLLASICGPADAAVPDGTAIPPMPTYGQLPMVMDSPAAFATGATVGMLTWVASRPIKGRPLVDLGAKEKQCWAWELVTRSWNPATGAIDERPLGLPGMVVGQTPVPAGILSLSDLGCQTPDSGGRLRLALLTSQGQLLTLETDEKIGAMAWHFLPVSDNATVIVTRVKATRHIVAYVVRRHEDRLTLERMPELPIAYRGDFAAAIAGPTEAAQLMILGGSDGEYRGCMECRRETHLLNLETRTWNAGSPMLEERSELGATRLPDASVLVTGGWTKQAGWGRGPSATAERWDPTTNRFAAITPMPTGTARHHGVWLPGQEGKSLLVTGGVSGTAQAYDVATRTWRTVAEWVEGSEEGGCGFLPFTFDGNAYAWALRRSEGHYSSKACMDQKFADLSLLRPPAGTAPPKVPPPESLLVTYRSGVSFLPAATVGRYERPAMIIGGTTHAGMNAYNVTSAVEAVGRDGRIWALPSLKNARSNPRAFRFGDGVLVIGGQAGWPHLDRDAAARVLPMEWLASSALDGEASWVELAGPGPSAHGALAQLGDGSLLEVGDAGVVTQWKPVPRAGAAGQPATLTLERHAWPRPNRDRRSTESSPVSVRELGDGRIIVAGGEVQSEKIALLTPDSQDPNAVDEYVGIGPYLPSRRHEIYDPASRRWRNSAPAVVPGGPVVIFDDGRVMKIGSAADGSKTADGQGKPDRRVLEISNADGTAWYAQPAGLGAGARMRLTYKYKPFAVDGELFVSGELADLSTGGGPSGVEWFNAASNRWELVWQSMAGDNWRAHQGRILVRKLANGKTVVLPVEGL